MGDGRPWFATKEDIDELIGGTGGCAGTASDGDDDSKAIVSTRCEIGRSKGTEYKKGL